jgi:hypothetical protein
VVLKDLQHFSLPGGLGDCSELQGRMSPEEATAAVAKSPDFDEGVYAPRHPVETPHLGGRATRRGPLWMRQRKGAVMVPGKHR